VARLDENTIDIMPEPTWLLHLLLRDRARLGAFRDQVLAPRRCAGHRTREPKEES
jgi:hypothetical protein